MRDLIRPLLWAVLIWFVAHVMWVFMDPTWTQLEDVETFGGRVLHSDLPPFLITFVVSFVAARLHPAPERFEKVRHAIVALLVPGLAVIAGIVLWVVNGTEAQWALLGLAAQIAGALGGWLLADMLPHRDKAAPPPVEYY